MTLEELTACRNKLRRARFKGVMTVAIDGESVTYKTDAQMAAALASIEAEISKLIKSISYENRLSVLVATKAPFDVSN